MPRTYYYAFPETKPTDLTLNPISNHLRIFYNLRAQSELNRFLQDKYTFAHILCLPTSKQ